MEVGEIDGCVWAQEDVRQILENLGVDHQIQVLAVPLVRIQKLSSDSMSSAVVVFLFFLNWNKGL